MRRGRFKAFSRNAFAKCYSVSGAVLISLVLVLASVGCDDDDGGDDSTPVAPAPDPGDNTDPTCSGWAGDHCQEAVDEGWINQEQSLALGDC